MKLIFPLLLFSPAFFAIPSQDTKKCSRKVCKTECNKSKPWYDLECVTCFSKKCLSDSDKSSEEYKEADCIQTVCKDNCHHSNITPCKRCLSNFCERYQNTGDCGKAKMMNQNNKIVPLGDEFFMRSSNNYVSECDEDGNYQEKQCDKFSGFCTCVDKLTGENLQKKLITFRKN